MAVYTMQLDLKATDMDVVYRQHRFVQITIGLSYFILPVIFFFGSEFSDLYKTVFSAGESLSYYFPLKMFSKHLSLWTDLICTGVPAMADPQFQTFYPISLIFMNLFPAPFSYNEFILIHYTLGGFFTYLFLRSVGLSRLSGYWGSVIFMFCGFFIAHRRHIVMLNAGIWLPLVLYSLQKIQSTFKVRYLLLGSFGIMMSTLAGYPHITMLLGFVTIGYAFWKSFNSKSPLRWNPVWAFFIMSFFAFLLASVQLFPIVEAFRTSTREAISYQFFTMYSFDFQYLPMLIYPFLFGGGYSSPLLNFRSPRLEVTELSGYIGVLPLFLAIFAVITLKKSKKEEWFWTIVCGVSFILILGSSSPFYRWLYQVPVYNLFRGPARNWYELDFALAMLSAFGLESLLQPKVANGPTKKSATFIAIGCIVFLCLSLIMFKIIRALPARHSFYSLVQVNSAKHFADNIEFGSVAVWLPALFLVLTACYLILIPRFSNSNVVCASLISFLLIDLFIFGYRHERFFLRYSEITQPTAVISFLKTQGDLNRFRIFSTSDLHFRTLLSPDTNMLFGLQTINGFEDVVLRNYSLMTGFNYLGVASAKQERVLLAYNRLLSLMSTEFIVTQDKELSNFLRTVTLNSKSVYTPVFQAKLEKVERSEMRMQIPQSIYNKIPQKRSGEIQIFRNENFMERVRFARTVFPVKDSEEAARLIWKSKSFDYRNGVVAEINDSSAQSLAGGVVINSKFSKDRIQLQVKTDGKSFLVLGDQFYNGWKATVDGVQATIYRTNAIMRGIYIQTPGIHKVEFSFVPKSLRYGLYVTLVTILAVIGITIWSARFKKF